MQRASAMTGYLIQIHLHVYCIVSLRLETMTVVFDDSRLEDFENLTTERFWVFFQGNKIKLSYQISRDYTKSLNCNPKLSFSEKKRSNNTYIHAVFIH